MIVRSFTAWPGDLEATGRVAFYDRMRFPMRKTAIIGTLMVGFALSISAGGCTGGEPAQFKSNFEEAVKAAEKGKAAMKEAMKDAKKSRPAKPGKRGPEAPAFEPHGLPDVS